MASIILRTRGCGSAEPIGEHRKILPVGEADEDSILGRLNVELRALRRRGLAREPLPEIGKQVGGGCLARFGGVGRRRIGRRRRRRSRSLSFGGDAALAAPLARSAIDCAGSSPDAAAARRSAGIGRHDIHRTVAAERTEWIAKRLVGARPDFAVALERRRGIDARPRRRRAGDLVEAGARIAEQFLLRHRRIGLGRIRRRQRRLRRRRATLLALVRGVRRRAVVSRCRPRIRRARPTASRRSARPNPRLADRRPFPARRGCPFAPSPAPRPSPD